jgi:hypothetical protein
MQQSHTFASNPSRHTSQSLQKSVPDPTQEAFQNIVSSPSKKIKTPDTQTDNVTADTYGHDNWTPEKEAHAHNKGLPKAGMTGFYDTFVLNRTLVFQIKGSAETPRLRQAPNRWQP